MTKDINSILIKRIFISLVLILCPFIVTTVWAVYCCQITGWSHSLPNADAPRAGELAEGIVGVLIFVFFAGISTVVLNYFIMGEEAWVYLLVKNLPPEKEPYQTGDLFTKDET